LEEAIIPGYKLTEEEIKFLEEPYVFILLELASDTDVESLQVSAH
jgi:hypothetical protein